MVLISPERLLLASVEFTALLPPDVPAGPRRRELGDRERTHGFPRPSASFSVGRSGPCRETAFEDRVWLPSTGWGPQAHGPIHPECFPTGRVSAHTYLTGPSFSTTSSRKPFLIPLAGPSQCPGLSPLMHWPYHVVPVYLPDSPMGLGAPKAAVSVSESLLA